MGVYGVCKLFMGGYGISVGVYGGSVKGYGVCKSFMGVYGVSVRVCGGLWGLRGALWWPMGSMGSLWGVYGALWGSIHLY